MAEDLGLNDHHQHAIVNYIRFARFQRVQCLRTITSIFRDVVNARLADETFTKEEVEEILNDLQSMVRGEVESELINSSHTNAILLRQLFQQAEQWHLKLIADIGQLENSELLKQIKLFEEEELMGATRERSSSSTSQVRTKLDPLNESAGTKLLQLKIDELTEANKIAEDNREEAELKAEEALKEKSILTEQMNVMAAELKLLQAKQEKSPVDDDQLSGGSGHTELDEMHKQLQQLQARITDMETDSKEKSIKSELAESKHELLKVKMQLETAQQELELNFNQTTAYNNMKKILVKKNEQIKHFRKLLKTYEPNFDHASID